jgi:hypothetical protein
MWMIQISVGCLYNQNYVASLRAFKTFWKKCLTSD